MNKPKRAVLFVNGKETPGYFVKTLPSDLLIAVDGGLRHLFAHKQMPDLLIGDLDSVDPHHLATCEAAKIEIIRFPVVKDETDLELALNIATERGAKQIVVAYAQGGRVDHTFANLSVLARPDLESVDIKFDDGKTEIILIKGPGKRSLITKLNDLVSLLPWGVASTGVTTQNLYYPLRKETLLPWQSRGVSNIATAKKVTISLTEGSLLVIHTRPEIGPKGNS